MDDVEVANAVQDGISLKGYPCFTLHGVKSHDNGRDNIVLDNRPAAIPEVAKTSAVSDPAKASSTPAAANPPQ